MADSPTLADVQAAAEAIAGRVHRTPMLTSATLAARCGAPVWLKAELFQRIGAFKPRGAFNRLRALTPEERELGTITISAGNHAQALALAARDEGVDALVLMPADASPLKVAATRGYGATVDLESADSMEALERMRAIAAETGRVIVHPYDDPLIVAGQGTVGLEIVADAPGVDTVIVPIGGGGLIAGIATAVKGLLPDARVIGVEPELSAAMRTALDAGHPVPAVPGPTIADALRSPVAGAIGLEVCSRLVRGCRPGLGRRDPRGHALPLRAGEAGVRARRGGRRGRAPRRASRRRGIEGRGARHLGRERLAPAGRRDPRRLTAMERLHPEVAKLGGGDRRSIGRSNEVVADVLADPTLFDLIFDAIASDDPLIAMRAADAVEKVTARRPELLRPHKRRLLTELASIPQQEVRWHVAQMLPRLSLSARERRQAAEIVESYLDDRSGIVRTCAMQALAELAADDAELRARVVPLLRRLTRDGTPAMRARGRRLLAELDPGEVSAARSPGADRARSARSRSDARKQP